MGRPNMSFEIAPDKTEQFFSETKGSNALNELLTRADKHKGGTMDRLEEIRQRTEAGGPIRRIDMKYLLSGVAELTELLNASKAGQLTLQKAWEQDKDELTARAEAAETERDAAIADLRKCSPCWLCKKKCGIFDALDQRKDGCCPNFEYRGQQAGKGKTE